MLGIFDGKCSDGEFRHLRDCQILVQLRFRFGCLLEISVDEIGDRVFITAYVAHPNSRQAIELINLAEEAGAHTAFLMQPFFTKPDDEGVFLYFKAVAKETNLPLVLYNCPSRAGINMSVDLMDRITDEVPNFVGLKTTTFDEFPEAVRRLSGKFKVIPGAEDQMLFGFALGSPGVLTFAANVIPDRPRRHPDDLGVRGPRGGEGHLAGVAADVQDHSHRAGPECRGLHAEPYGLEFRHAASSGTRAV